MSDSKLIVAVPSKGRLQENANAFFARAGLDVVQGRGARDYRGVLKGVDNVEIAFLSASDITAHLAQGSVHMGVTGEDLVDAQPTFDQNGRPAVSFRFDPAGARKFCTPC